MAQTTLIIDNTTGALTIEGWTEADLRGMEDLLAAPDEVNCARPIAGIVPLAPRAPGAIRVHRLYTGSVVDGPGRRSVIQVQGCPVRCAGCYVPETHADSGGTMMHADDALAVLLSDERADGVTFLGGEPTAQAKELLPLARAVKARGIHLLVYTGYTVERTARFGSQAARDLLALADLVVDGPYVAAMGAGAGEFRGSTNQRILDRNDVRSILDAQSQTRGHDRAH